MKDAASLAFSIAFATHVLFTFCICRRAWQCFRVRRPDRQFNYHVTDLWAAIVGLTPSIMAVAYVCQGRATALEALCWSMLPLSQIAGVFCGRLHFLTDEIDDAAVPSAGCILTGAFFGGCFLPVYLIGFVFVFPAVVVYLVLYLIGPTLHAERRA